MTLRVLVRTVDAYSAITQAECVSQ
jgi:hypothetical protein